MPQYLAPGVYVEEVPSAIKPIAGVGTSTAGFIGTVADDVTMPVQPGRTGEPAGADRYPSSGRRRHPEADHQLGRQFKKRSATSRPGTGRWPRRCTASSTTAVAAASSARVAADAGDDGVIAALDGFAVHRRDRHRGRSRRAVSDAVAERRPRPLRERVPARPLRDPRRAPRDRPHQGRHPGRHPRQQLRRDLLPLDRAGETRQPGRGRLPPPSGHVAGRVRPRGQPSAACTRRPPTR